MSRKLILCDCLGSMSLNADQISQASGMGCSKIHNALCMEEIGQAAKEIQSGDVIIACQQERQRFADLAAELEVEEPGFVDIRDRAGWTHPSEDPNAKIAALVAEAALPVPVPKSIDVISEGVCLIIGASNVALLAAELLSDTLAVTVLLTDDSEPPESRRFDVINGTLKSATGALGDFELRIENLQEAARGGRGAFGWSMPRNGARSVCDIILDLSGQSPLFSAHEKREGYLRADPGHAEAVTRAVTGALKLIGTFEQPLYVKLEEPLCAHSRAEQTGCKRCLDICPTGAITAADEHVAVDPMICAGCGGCSSVCPSGAISYDAPPHDALMRRLSTLSRVYREAGGVAPRLLVHDTWGGEMISLAARYAEGLPANVIPLEISSMSIFGHAEMLAAQAVGFADVILLCSPSTERNAVEYQANLARALSATVSLIDPGEPDVLRASLPELFASKAVEPILPVGTRRQITRLSAKALNPEKPTLPLPEDAPYGAVLVDTDRCTLCLSCVSLCPSGALGDNPDLPQLRFQEDACLQCGLCASICPEDAITLQPQLNLTDAALSQQVLNEEEPFACVECGSLFGVKSTIERITEKLGGTHSMYQNPAALRMIQMCDNCRIQAQYHSESSPFAGAERPRVRTTDDYLSKRRDH